MRWRLITTGTAVAVAICGAGAPATAQTTGSGPAPFRATTKSNAPDYNGDGFADLAIGGSSIPPGEEYYQGTLTVIYGSATGLRRAGNQLWRATDFAGGRSLDGFASVLASGDFDGDGYTDLAAANRPSAEDTRPWHGEVRIIYGSSSGLTPARSQVWNPDSPGVPGADPDARAGDDEFAYALAAGDFGRGPQDDLAVGDPGARGRRGAVTVLYGSGAGLSAVGSQVWSQSSPGVPGRAAPEEDFGTSLAAGDFSGDGHADLAVGVPLDRSTRDDEGPGAVNVLYGSAAGLTNANAQWWSQSSPGIKGRARAEEGFGATLAAGHFAGRRTADLAVGVPSDNNWRDNAGAVNVLYGSSRGLSSRGNHIFHRRTPRLVDPHKLDSFVGETLAVGNFGDDSGSDPAGRFDDLAFGAQNQLSVDGGGSNVGAVEVVYGRPGGLSARHSQNWRLASPGVPGHRGRWSGDGFGNALLAADFGRSAFDDLVAGDSLYEVDEQHFGVATVLYGANRGLSARGAQQWSVPALGRAVPRFLWPIG